MAYKTLNEFKEDSSDNLTNYDGLSKVGIFKNATELSCGLIIEGGLHPWANLIHETAEKYHEAGKGIFMDFNSIFPNLPHLNWDNIVEYSFRGGEVLGVLLAGTAAYGLFKKYKKRKERRQRETQSDIAQTDSL